MGDRKTGKGFEVRGDRKTGKGFEVMGDRKDREMNRVFPSPIAYRPF
jgi:hypothetical protein